MHARDTLILGCGYLGRYLLAIVPPGTALAVTRSPSRHAELAAAGAATLAADVLGDGAAPWVAALAGFTGTAYVLLPPSAFAVPGAAAQASALAGLLIAHGVRRGILASSTAIYAARDGEIVTATSPVTATGPRSARLMDIEQAWLAADFDARVVRFAGLYGPERVVGRASILAGETLPGDGEEWLNLVRIEDAARALRATALVAQPERIGLVADGTPVRRREYYDHLARLLGRPAPSFAGQGTREGGSRRCDPTSTWRRLGLTPLYPGYRAGLRDLL